MAQQERELAVLPDAHHPHEVAHDCNPSSRGAQALFGAQCAPTLTHAQTNKLCPAPVT